jgi:hypothetical protein
VVLGQIFSEYFGFSCQFSFHRLLHNHHLSSGDGTIGQLVADVPIGLHLTPLREKLGFSLPAVRAPRRRWASHVALESQGSKVCLSFILISPFKQEGRADIVFMTREQTLLSFPLHLPHRSSQPDSELTMNAITDLAINCSQRALRPVSKPLRGLPAINGTYSIPQPTGSLNTFPQKQNRGTIGYLLLGNGALYTSEGTDAFSMDPSCAEAWSNTSTLALRVVGGDEKRCLESQTAKYDRESHRTRTRKLLSW